MQYEFPCLNGESNYEMPNNLEDNGFHPSKITRQIQSSQLLRGINSIDMPITETQRGGYPLHMKRQQKGVIQLENGIQMTLQTSIQCETMDQHPQNSMNRNETPENNHLSLSSVIEEDNDTINAVVYVQLNNNIFKVVTVIALHNLLAEQNKQGLTSDNLLQLRDNLIQSQNRKTSDSSIQSDATIPLNKSLQCQNCGSMDIVAAGRESSPDQKQSSQRKNSVYLKKSEEILPKKSKCILKNRKLKLKNVKNTECNQNREIYQNNNVKMEEDITSYTQQDKQIPVSHFPLRDDSVQNSNNDFKLSFKENSSLTNNMQQKLLQNDSFSSPKSSTFLRLEQCNLQETQGKCGSISESFGQLLPALRENEEDNKVSSFEFSGENIAKTEKKNVVKNFVKAFITFVKKNADSLFLSESDSQKRHQVKKFDNYMRKCKYNHLFMKQLLSKSDYSQIFSQFMTIHANEWLEKSQVQDKQAHKQMLLFFQNSIADSNELDKLRVLKKKKNQRIWVNKSRLPPLLICNNNPQLHSFEKQFTAEIHKNAVIPESNQPAFTPSQQIDRS